jgi:hypothetical protein
MLTVQTKARIFDATNRQRERFTRWAVKITARALTKQLKPFLNSKVYTVASVKKTIKPKEIEALLKDIYTRVGLRFARATHNGLLKQKAEFSEAAFDAIIADYLDDVGAENVVGITQTTQNILIRIVEEGIEEGLSVQEMERSIRGRVAPLYKNRALTIARTETIAASNFGSISGARMTGLDLIKEWITTNDSRTRDNHFFVGGQKRDNDELFNVGGDLLDYPLDASHGASASNIVNCRCTLGYSKK